MNENSMELVTAVLSSLREILSSKNGVALFGIFAILAIVITREVAEQSEAAVEHGYDVAVSGGTGLGIHFTRDPIVSADHDGIEINDTP